MSQIIPFEFKESKVRVIKDGKEQPWFVGKDIADALGYVDSKQAIRKHCKRPELLKGVESTPLTSRWQHKVFNPL